MSREWFRKRWQWVPRPVRIVLVLLIGGTVVLIGLAMIVLPGPAVVVVPLGLAILALEFAFARRWLKHLKRNALAMQHRVQNGWHHGKITGRCRSMWHWMKCRVKRDAAGREDHDEILSDRDTTGQTPY